jgi:photosystem II stability/assembly factor-like uncharacterized protein
MHWQGTMARFVSMVIGVAVWATTTAGAVNRWTAVGPIDGHGLTYEGGTNVLSLAVDPTAPGTVLASSPDGIFSTTDRGGSWSRLAATPEGVLVRDPVAPATIYAWAPRQPLVRSTDGGSTWTSLPIVALGLAVDPTQNSRLFAIPAAPYELYLSRSDDGGQTWIGVDVGPRGVKTVAVDVYGNVFISANDGVFRSTDHGSSWTQQASLPCDAIAFAPGRPGTMYCMAPADGGTIGRSDDGGATWRTDNFSVPGTLYSYRADALAVDPVDDATLYAATEPLGLFRSVDRGVHWTPIGGGLANPLIPDARITVTDVRVDGARGVFVATREAGAFRSDDGGLTWTPLGVPRTTARFVARSPYAPALYAQTDRAFFESTDGGSTWALQYVLNGPAFPSTITAMAFDPRDPAVRWASGVLLVPRGRYNATEVHVVKTVDGGATWNSSLQTGDGGAVLYGASRVSLAVPSQTPDVIYVGSPVSLGRMFRSRDAGATWQTAPAPQPGVGVSTLALDPATTATLYAGTGPASLGFDSSIYRSTDGAASWTALLSLHAPVTAIVVDPHVTTTVYAATGVLPPIEPRPGAPGGVLRSVDAGTTWQSVSVGLDGSSVHALAVDPMDTAVLWAATDAGVFSTRTAGEEWVHAGLASPTYALVIDPAQPATLYAATANHGIQRLDVVPCAVSGCDDDDACTVDACMPAAAGADFAGCTHVRSGFPGADCALREAGERPLCTDGTVKARLARLVEKRLHIARGLVQRAAAADARRHRRQLVRQAMRTVRAARRALRAARPKAIPRACGHDAAERMNDLLTMIRGVL